MRRVLTLVVLVGFWVALWEDLSWANVLGGIAAGALAMVLAPVAPSHPGLVFRPVAALRFTLYFAWKLVEASLIVAWEVITPRNRINEAIVAVPLRVDRPIIVTMIGNSVSLTPGTLTLEARMNPPLLYIHVLHLKSVEAVRSDVRRLEDLAVRALVADADVAVKEPTPGSDRRSRDGGDRP